MTKKALLDVTVVEFIRDLKKNAFVQKNLSREILGDGATALYPVTVFPQGQIVLLWKSNRPCDKFIREMVSKYPKLLQSGEFKKGNKYYSSCIVFLVHDYPIMDGNDQLNYLTIHGKYFDRSDIEIFAKGDVVVAKPQYIDKHEKEIDTVGIVVDYNPANDFLSVGVLNPENYALPPVSSMRGEYYRLVTSSEKNKWNLK